MPSISRLTGETPVLRPRPKCLLLYSNLAAVLLVRGEIDSAIACCERALRLQPDLLVAHTNLSKLLVSLGRMEEAEGLYRHAIALKPDSAEAHFKLGNLYCQLDRLEEAIDCFRAAICCKPDCAAAGNSLGVALQSPGQMNLAQACFWQALKLQPDMANAKRRSPATSERSHSTRKTLTYFTASACCAWCDWKGCDSTVKELASRTEAQLNSGKLAFLPAVTLIFLNRQDAPVRQGGLIAPCPMPHAPCSPMAVFAPGKS